MFKKIVFCVLLILSLSFAFAGCSSSNSNTGYQDLLDRIEALEGQLADSDVDTLLERIAELELDLQASISVTEQELEALKSAKGLVEVDTSGVVFSITYIGSSIDNLIFTPVDFDFMIVTINYESPYIGCYKHSFIATSGTTQINLGGLYREYNHISAIAYKYS